MANKLEVELGQRGEAEVSAAMRRVVEQAQATTGAINQTGKDGAQGFATLEREAVKLKAQLNSNEAALHNLARAYDQVADKAKNAATVAGASQGANIARQQAQQLSGFSNEFAAGNVGLQRFKEIQAGAGAAKEVVSNLRVGVSALRDELGKEPSGGRAKIFQVAEGVLFRDVVKDTISYAVQLGEALVKSFRESRAAQEQLTVTALDYGQQVQANIKAAERLAATSAGLLTGTEAQGLQGVALQLAGKAGRPQDANAIAQAALDLAAQRGISDTASVAKLLQQFGAGSETVAEQLVGPYSSDRYVQAQRARERGVPQNALTPEDTLNARLDELTRRGAQFSGAAGQRGQLTGVQLDKASSSLEGFAEFINRHPVLAGVANLSPVGVAGNIVGGLENFNLSLARQAPQTPDALARAQQIGGQEEARGRGAQNRLDEAKQAQRDLKDFQAQLEVALGESNIARKGAGLQALQQRFRDLSGELKKFPDAIDPVDVDKLGGRLANGIGQTSKEIARLRADAAGLLAEFDAKAEANPFVKLFAETDKSIEHTRQQFAALGSDTVDQLTKAQRAAESFQVTNLRVAASLKAVELEFQADKLEHGYQGITAEQQRQLSILQKQIEAAKSVVSLRREASAFERGFVAQNQFQVRREDFENYERLKRLRPQGTDEGARAGQKLIDDQILEQTKALGIGARNSPDPITRQLAADRAAALRAQADRAEANVRDEIARAQAGRGGVELAQRKLQELSKFAGQPGFDRDRTRSEFLAVTGKLDPKELTGALREAQIGAAREEAAHQRELEQQTRNFQQELVSSGGILAQIKTAVVDSGNKAAQAASASPSKAEEQAGLEARDAREHAPGASRTVVPPWLAEAVRPAQADPAEKKMRFERQLKALLANPNIHVDPLALVTNPTSDQQVNPYAQELFRARPGYSAANDPRVFDASDPYAREFLRAGYGGNYKATSADGAHPADKIVELLGQLVAAAKAGTNLTIKVGDGLELDHVLGQAPKPLSPAQEYAAQNGVRHIGGDGY